VVKKKPREHILLMHDRKRKGRSQAEGKRVSRLNPRCFLNSETRKSFLKPLRNVMRLGEGAPRQQKKRKGQSVGGLTREEGAKNKRTRRSLLRVGATQHKKDIRAGLRKKKGTAPGCLGGTGALEKQKPVHTQNNVKQKIPKWATAALHRQSKIQCGQM